MDAYLQEHRTISHSMPVPGVTLADPVRVPSHSPTYGSGHIPALDGLRGVAVLLVMGVHMAVLDSPRLADRLFLFGAYLGWIGVDLFFVLSGFLITGILYDAKGSPHYFRNFYMRRSLRIFPLYYTVAFVVLVVAPQVWDSATSASAASAWPHDWSHWVYLSNFMIAAEERFGTGPLIVTWSLAVEEQFYLLWAPVVYRLRHSQLVRLCIVLIVVALALRVVMTLAGVHPAALYVLPFTRMDALAVGALLAIYVRRTGSVETLSRIARRVGPLAALCVLGVTAWDMDPTWRGTATQTIGYTLLAIMFGCLLVLTIAPDSRRVRPLMSSRQLRTFGKYSYALYLFHLPIRAFIRDHVYGPDEFHTLFGSQLPGQLLFYALGIAAALAAAWCSWHLFEKHLLRLKRYFPLEPARRTEVESPAAVVVT